jgi:outer membrane protein TolC
MFELIRLYWNLYLCYRQLDAAQAGCDHALSTWRQVKSRQRAGREGGSAADEAQSREQYFGIRAELEQVLSDLFSAENQLRYVMGVASSDGRLILPADEPSTARFIVDWDSVKKEALTRSPEMRRQKLRIEEHRSQIRAQREKLVPQLDAAVLDRWLGVGDLPPTADDSREEERSEWQRGIEFSMPLGVRSALATLRNLQMQLGRAEARLENMENEVEHQLSMCVKRLTDQYIIVQTQLNRTRDAVLALHTQAIDCAQIDLLIDAQRRSAQAEAAFYRALTSHQIARAEIQWRSGTLLESHGYSLIEAAAGSSKSSAATAK